MNTQEQDTSDKLLTKGPVVFLLLWLAAFLLYLPAAKAGWVIDATGWLFEITHEKFWDYINRTHSPTQSQYQLTQFITWVCYKIWGANAYAWSLLYITLHALNAFLLYTICKNLFQRSGAGNAATVALCGALLFVICPHASEVVIWKACYHYLQGFFFILISLYWVQQYHEHQQNKYIWFCCALFFVATFSLEVFYITPLLLLCMAVYYRLVLNYSKQIFSRIISRIVLPQLALLGGYFLLFYLRYGSIRPHGHGINYKEVIGYLAKPLKYLFHQLFLGRYFTPQIKNKVYAVSESGFVMALFYGVVAFGVIYLIREMKKGDPLNKTLFILFGWLLIIFGLLLPLPFPDSALLVFYDRYCYLPAGFIYMLLAAVLFWKCNKNVAITVLLLFGGINIYFTVQLNRYWKQSAYISNRLLTGLPPAGTKKILLLNLPENMNGVAMMGADPGGQFKAMHDLLIDTTIKNTIYDVMSYNMLTMHDGANVKVINDSTITVTLNQWGTWWWHGGHGGNSYECADYKVNLKDPGHWYELTLKHPANEYLLLYEVGELWKTVDMQQRDKEQN